jgi:hypothetical protein
MSYLLMSYLLASSSFSVTWLSNAIDDRGFVDERPIFDEPLEVELTRSKVMDKRAVATSRPASEVRAVECHSATVNLGIHVGAVRTRAEGENAKGCVMMMLY